MIILKKLRSNIKELNTPDTFGPLLENIFITYYHKKELIRYRISFEGTTRIIHNSIFNPNNNDLQIINASHTTTLKYYFIGTYMEKSVEYVPNNPKIAILQPKSLTQADINFINDFLTQKILISRLKTPNQGIYSVFITLNRNKPIINKITNLRILQPTPETMKNLKKKLQVLKQK